MIDKTLIYLQKVPLTSTVRGLENHQNLSIPVTNNFESRTNPLPDKQLKINDSAIGRGYLSRRGMCPYTPWNQHFRR